jgi:hypothetical protein
MKISSKVFAISSLLVVSLSPNVAHAGGWAITPAVGYEEVTVPTAGLKFGVNLYGIVARYN